MRIIYNIGVSKPLTGITIGSTIQGIEKGNHKMNYKYAGKEFEIVWNDDGKFSCNELGIVKDNPDEVKAEIRAQTEKEKTLPRVNVLLLSEKTVIEATTNLRKVYSRYSYGDDIWVSWKEGGKAERKKIRTNQVYKDTPENRALLNQYCKLMRESERLVREARNNEEKAETVEAIKL